MQSFIRDDLTVIIPLYNKRETIERAVRSVLSQKLLPNIILVIDDGSEDDGPQRVLKLQSEHPCIKLIEQENMGVSAARNRGAMEAETEYIAFLDADDEWMTEYTSNLDMLISKNIDADFYTLPYFIDTPEGRLKPHVELPESFNGIISNFVKTYSCGYGLIHSSSVCFRRSFFFETGGFPITMQSGEDIFLWLKAGLKGACAAINKRCVVLYKDEIDNFGFKKKNVPYHVSYFEEHLKDYSADERKEIRYFLGKFIFLLWATAKIEKDRCLRNVLRSLLYKINKLEWLILLFSELIPASLFELIRKKRINNGLKK